MSDFKPLVSVIVPCYNAGSFLAETLDSVISQTYNEWECIIVNDGSDDNSEDVSMYYVNLDSRIKYVFQTNQGPSVARNNGISMSKGTFILPLDADDIIEATYIEKAISHFIKYPNTKLVYCKADKFGEINEPWNLPKYSYDNLIRSNCLFATAFFRRVDFNIVGGYNPNMRDGLEDWELWLEILHPNDVVYQIDETLFHYRIRDVSRSTIAYKNRESLFCKMRAVDSPEFQFARERFYFRKHIFLWPFKVFSKSNKKKYLKFYGEKWRRFQFHDICECLVYPYMVIYRRFLKNNSSLNFRN